MESLNPGWLGIEVEAIEAEVEGWTGAIRASYQAALHSMTVAGSIDEGDRPMSVAAEVAPSNR
jgi:hypothetical protein